MSQYSLLPGERIKLNNELYHLRRKLNGSKWQLEKDTNGEYVVIEESELLDLYFRNMMSFVSSFTNINADEEAFENRIIKNFSAYPEKLQRVAKCRLKYIKTVKGKTDVDVIIELQKQAKKQGDGAPPHISTVKHWQEIFKESGSDICSLIPNYCKRGNKKPRYPEEVVSIAIREINRLYLNQNRNSKKETLSAVRDAIDKENMRLPSHEQLPKPQIKFVRNIIAAIDAFEVEKARNGKNAANKRFREAITSGESVLEPLDRVEIDHTVLDLIVVDANNYLPLGRPTITIAFDRCTRCICGYHVGFDPPSYVSIMKCLSHAIKPKEYVKEKYPEIENNWPCWGIPQLIVVDNGREFHSKDLEAATMSLLIDIRYCPTGQPWWKGAVERFFRTMSKALIHQIPGSTFSNIKDKGDYNSLKMAIITEADLNELLHTWICDVYHQTVHRATLRTPFSLWRERITSSMQTLAASVELLDVSLSSVERRTLFHYGVSLNNLNYNSPQLQKIRKKYGEIPVQIRWDRSDLAAVYVLDEATNTYLNVPCTWKGYASGLSLWLHKAIRDEALSYEGRESEAKLDAAKARVRALYEKALNKKKLVTRKAVARAQPSFNNSINPIQINLPDQINTLNVNTRDDCPKENTENDRTDEIPVYEVLDKAKK